MNGNETYLTSGEAARWLHIGKKTLLRAVRRGELTPVARTPRGYARFRATDLAAYADQLAARSGAGAPASPRHALAPLHGGNSAGMDADGSVSPTDGIGMALMRLASLALDAGQNIDGAIDGILALLADSLGAGAVFLVRVDREKLRIERAYDRAGLSLAPGAAVPLCDTY